MVRVFTAIWVDTHVQILHDMYWIEEDKSKQQIICLSLVSTIMKCVSLFLALSGSFIIQMIIKQDILFPQVYSTSNTQKSATNPEITLWRRTSFPVFTSLKLHLPHIPSKEGTKSHDIVMGKKINCMSNCSIWWKILIIQVS